MTHDGDKGEDRNAAPSGMPRLMSCASDSGRKSSVGGRRIVGEKAMVSGKRPADGKRFVGERTIVEG